MPRNVPAAFVVPVLVVTGNEKRLNFAVTLGRLGCPLILL
jgi:hypothetical protein